MHNPDPEPELKPLRAQLADVQEQLSKALAACQALGAMCSTAVIARDLTAEMVVAPLSHDPDHPTARLAVAEELLGYALHLRQESRGDVNGWRSFDRQAEHFLRFRWPDKPQPRRDDDVAAWILRCRELYRQCDDRTNSVWHAIDAMLYDYHEHADTGTPLDREVQKGKI